MANWVNVFCKKIHTLIVHSLFRIESCETYDTDPFDHDQLINKEQLSVNILPR